MTNLIKADFNGTQVLFQQDAYLNATTIAKAFGKQPKDYLRNERTGDYVKALINKLNSNRRNCLIEENQIVIKRGGSSTNGGGTWLHPKLAIDFARWLSAEFAVWCDEQIEKILYKQFEQPKLSDLSSVESRVPLKDAVNMMVPKIGLSYSDCYKMVHQRFGVKSVEELTHEQIPQAVEYVHTVFSGELLPREAIEQPKLINDNRNSRVAAMAMMRVGSLAKTRQDRIIGKLESLLFEIRECVLEFNECNGMVHDGLSESRLHFGFNPVESKEANKRAAEIFERKFG